MGCVRKAVCFQPFCFQQRRCMFLRTTVTAGALQSSETWVGRTTPLWSRTQNADRRTLPLAERSSPYKSVMTTPFFIGSSWSEIWNFWWARTSYSPSFCSLFAAAERRTQNAERSLDQNAQNDVLPTQIFNALWLWLFLTFWVLLRRVWKPCFWKSSEKLTSHTGDWREGRGRSIFIVG